MRIVPRDLVVADGWTHVAITRNAGASHIFLNGQEIMLGSQPEAFIGLDALTRRALMPGLVAKIYNADGGDFTFEDWVPLKGIAVAPLSRVTTGVARYS